MSFYCTIDNLDITAMIVQFNFTMLIFYVFVTDTINTVHLLCCQQCRYNDYIYEVQPHNEDILIS